MAYTIFLGTFNSEITHLFTLTLLTILLLSQILRKWESLAVSNLDKVIILYSIYSISHVIIVDNGIDSADIGKWIAVLIVYMLMRNCQYKKRIFHLLILSGLIESFIALAQKTNLLESNHTQFAVTGHFSNPGPLGGYLAICLVITIFLLQEAYKNKIHKLIIYLIIATILIATGLILSDSRAAILSILGGSLFPIHRILAQPLQKKAILSTGVIIFIIGTLLYMYRPQSANARLLIGRISTEMIVERPLFGHGIGTFDKKYMMYQARYFERNNHIDEIMVADNTGYAYNELLHLLAEVGFVGLFIVLFILGIIYMKKPTSADINTNIAKAGIAVWFIFSMFSYPVNIFPLLLLLPLFLGCIQSYEFKTTFAPRYIYIPLSLILFTIGIWSFRQGFFYYKASQELHKLTHKNDTAALKYIKHHYPQLKQNIKFSMIFHRWLTRHSTNKVDLIYIKEIVPTSESYCWVGDYYFRVAMYKEAEKAYQTASFMVPTRLKPNYKLWRLYINMEDSIRSATIAQKLLLQPLKVENSFTINAKTEVRTHLIKKK